MTIYDIRFLNFCGFLLINFCGFLLILDGLLSMFLVKDKAVLWQLGRIIRILIGIYLIFFVNQ